MNPFKKLLHNKHGIAAAIIQLVVVFVVLGVSLVIGLILNMKLWAVANQTKMGTVGNATRDSMFKAINDAYSLSTILPYVVVASIIIVAIVGGFAIYKSRTT
jgi:hypothetical protein